MAGQVRPCVAALASSRFPLMIDTWSRGVGGELDDLTGKYAVDARAANQQAGLTRTPEGYVWHLVEDALTLQLLPQDIHAAVRHTGGAGVVRSRLHS